MTFYTRLVETTLSPFATACPRLGSSLARPHGAEVSQVTISFAGPAAACSGSHRGDRREALALLEGGLFGERGPWSLAAPDGEALVAPLTDCHGYWSLHCRAAGPLAIAISGGGAFCLYFFDLADDTLLSGLYSTEGLPPRLWVNGTRSPRLSELAVYRPRSRR